jgi:radical SAM protein with 4Fe4S-binding SPASM domain
LRVIDVSELLCGLEPPDRGAPSGAAERGPVVAWNVTRTCNLACTHCSADSDAEAYPGELSTEQGRVLLGDLARFGVRGVVLSGGEPLVRRDTLELAEYGRARGLTITLATNGTLLDLDTARLIRDIGLSYVEVSLHGVGATSDVFCGKRRAFERAAQGIRNCKAVGQKVGVRLTLTPQTIVDLDAIFDFIDQENIERACFSHLVPSGRANGPAGFMHHETRHALRTIARRSREYGAGGGARRILTVDNHTDGPFLYLMLLAEGRAADAARAHAALARDGGGRSASGVGLCAIDSQGNVRPDQFWQTATLGNVKERRFSEIWTDPDIELLAELRDRLPRLKGRCATCHYLNLCGGNLRVRALAQTGDMWAPDPACYLSDAEIATDAQIVLV